MTIIPANTIPCITVRQPWAWSMFALGDESKDIENRSQRIVNYRGPMAIHVAQYWSPRNIEQDIVAVAGIFAGFRAITVERALQYWATSKTAMQHQLGHVIGIVDVVDCIRDSASRWAMPGQWHWVLRNNRQVRPVPIKGQQGRFVCPVELEVL